MKINLFVFDCEGLINTTECHYKIKKIEALIPVGFKFVMLHYGKDTECDVQVTVRRDMSYNETN